MNKTSEEVIKLLNEKIPREAVSTRRGSGTQTLSYLETWYVIDRLNTCFGNTGWDCETVEMEQVDGPSFYRVSQDGPPSTAKVAYRAKVRITACVSTGDGGYMKIIKEGTGWGSDKSALNPHEMATKEAESDALKRAAMKFGMSLGLALYDKSQENVEDAQASAPQAQPAQSRETVNKAINTEAKIADARGKQTLAQTKALITAYGVEKAAELTDAQATELLTKLKELNRG